MYVVCRVMYVESRIFQLLYCAIPRERVNVKQWRQVSQYYYHITNDESRHY